MRLARAMVGGLLLGSGWLIVSMPSTGAQVPTCTGNDRIQTAPYTCTATRDITGVTFTINLDVDAAGRAVIDYQMSPAQAADILIALHNYTDINQDPRQVINGSIPAGQTTAQLVIPTIDCGQIDIKAVEVTPRTPGGLIAGPVVTWGQACQQVPTSVPTTVAPTTVGPTTSVTVSPTSAGRVTTTLPSTGGDGAIPWTWGLVALLAGVVLVIIPWFWATDD